jgi:hypothetical protein
MFFWNFNIREAAALPRIPPRLSIVKLHGFFEISGIACYPGIPEKHVKVFASEIIRV